jgi:hypothetical protein
MIVILAGQEPLYPDQESHPSHELTNARPLLQDTEQVVAEFRQPLPEHHTGSTLMLEKLELAAIQISVSRHKHRQTT